MKATYKVNKKLLVELEGETAKSLFKELAVVSEIFGQETCGLCKKDNISYRVRNNDDNDYYENVCQDCGAILAYGVHKKGGTLFPKRKDKDGKFIGQNGWHKWAGKSVVDEEA